MSENGRAFLAPFLHAAWHAPRELACPVRGGTCPDDMCPCAGMFEAHDQDTRKLKAEQWRAQQRALREATKPYWEKPPWLVGMPVNHRDPQILLLCAETHHLQCLSQEGRDALSGSAREG